MEYELYFGRKSLGKIDSESLPREGDKMEYSGRHYIVREIIHQIDGEDNASTPLESRVKVVVNYSTGVIRRNARIREEAIRNLKPRGRQRVKTVFVEKEKEPSWLRLWFTAEHLRRV